MLVGRVWNDLVREYAQAAGRGPVRRLARLEAPPMIADAPTNPKWHEADLRYRQARRQLETEIREANAGSDAVWRAVARFIYSPLTLFTLLACLWVYFLLRMIGVTQAIERAVWQAF
jgi:hypothetical protein